MNEKSYKENHLVDEEMYKSFFNQLNGNKMYITEVLNDAEDSIEKEIRANRDDKLICAYKFYKNNSQPTEYYIFADPNKEDTISPKKIRHIKLNTKEEVQGLMDFLSFLQKQKKI